ncbi:hypothetical protein FHG87_017919 [Trinorchestia longiramus]|nr:hypothetical protein FHG87_017919 [Trinorchestia longiramus]
MKAHAFCLRLSSQEAFRNFLHPLRRAQFHSYTGQSLHSTPQASSVSQSGPYRPPGGVEEMQGGGRRVCLEWGAYITYNTGCLKKMYSPFNRC